MSLRDTLIRIIGKDEVSPAANKAGGSLRALGREATSLARNQLVQGFGLAGMVAGLGKAVQAANDLEASTRKLEATAKITGVALDVLQAVAARGKGDFSLSAMVANEYATELAKLASKAGDVGKASPLLQSFLDIGAARGLGAADTLQAVRQAILGIDEGTDKLFGKNPSVIYAEFAATIGTTAGKLTDQEKALALVTETLETGEKVRGEYVAWLGTAAGKSEQLTNATQTSAAELGRAMQPALAAILPALAELAGWLGKGIQWFQRFAVGVAIELERIPNAVRQQRGMVQVLIGEMLKSIGDFVPFFGKRLQAQGDALIAEGRRQVDAGTRYAALLVQVKQEAEDEILGIVRTSGTRQVAETTATGTKVTKATTDAGAKRAAAEANAAAKAHAAREKWNRETLAQLQTLGKWLGQERDTQAKDAAASAQLLAEQLQVNLGEATAHALVMTTGAMERLLATLRGKIPVEQWQALNAAVQQHKRDLGDTLPPAQALAESAKEAADENARLAQEIKETKGATSEVAQQAATVARALVDAGQAAGVLDAEMASALTSVINIAAALPKALGGDTASIGAVVAGLANLIVNWGSNPAEAARKAAMAQNTEAIQRLSKELGDYNVSESGESFAAITSALGEITQENEANGVGGFPTTGQVKAKFREKGISFSDAKKLAERYGIDVENDREGWAALWYVLGNKQYGGAAGNFGDELSALTSSFDVLGVDDADDRLNQLREFLSSRIPVLGDALAGDLSTPGGLAAAAQKLKDIYRDSIAGKLSPAQYGKANPAQLRQIIATMLPLLGDADGILTIPTVTPTPPDVGGTASLAASPILALASGAAGMPPIPQGALPHGWGPPIGAPAIPGTMVDTPTTVTTTINGGVNNYFSFPDITDSREAAEAVAARVADILGRSYAAQRAALGLGA